MRRIRFSVRTLFIFVTLVCTYFGAWMATKKYGVPQFGTGTSPMPFVVCQNTITVNFAPNGREILMGPRFYHVWLFGPTIKLPFEWHPSKRLPPTQL